MRESWPYRTDLRTFARGFASGAKRQLWRDNSPSKAEKMLFVGFFFIRRLIECRKVTDRCANSNITVSRGPILRTREVSAFRPDDLFDDISQVEWTDSKVDVHQLADKIIHAWWIAALVNESSGLAGFVFTTDKHRNKELWLLSTSSIVEVFKRFANSSVRNVQSKRDERGRMTYWRAE